MRSLWFAGMKLLAAALIASAAGTACSGAERHQMRGPGTMVSLSQADNDRTVDVRVGDNVQVTLPENATTGFRWAVDHFDTTRVELVGSEARYGSNRIGAGGDVAFTFRATKAGTSDVALKHWRHFEGDKSIIGRFRIRLHAQP
jgi:inhibitor of cysteine peptidase